MDAGTLGMANKRTADSRRGLTEFGRLTSPPVAGRVFRPTGFANLTGNTFRRVYVMQASATKIRLVYTNLCMTASAEGSLGAYVIAAARVWFEGASNISYAVTFNGATTATVNTFQTVVSDPIPVSYNTVVGSVFAVDTYVTHGAGTYLPRDANGLSIVGGISEGYGAGDITANNSNFFNLSGHDASFGPTSVIGWSEGDRHSTTAILGDSIAFGSGYAAGAGNSSFLNYALDDAGVGGLNLALAGETVLLALDFKKVINRLAAAQGCVNVISQYGINDLTASATLATMKTRYLSLWALLAARFPGVFQTTIGPHTSSSDNWRTVSNQTIAAEESVRQTVNQWLRAPASAGAGNSAMYDAGGDLTGVFDVAAQVEANSGGTLTTINPATGAISNGSGGFFAVDETVYLTGTGTGFGSQSMTDSTKMFTTQQYSGYFIRITADASTPVSVGQVRHISATEPTVLRLDTAWTNTPSVGASYELRKLPTFDGLHPSTWTHRSMALGVDASRLKKL